MERNININGNNFTSLSKAINYVVSLFNTKGKNSKFSLGDEVVIYKNSERVNRAARIGRCGVVDGFKCGDVVVLLNNSNEIAYIYEDDLLLLQK